MLHLEGHKDFVLHLAFSPDSRLLATGGADNTLRTWDLTLAAQRGRAYRYREWVATTAFSPDGSLLAAGGHDGFVRVYRARGGRPLCRLTKDTRAISCVAFSPCGRYLACAGYSSPVRVYDLEERCFRATLPPADGRHGSGHEKFSLCYSPDGAFLVAGGHPGFLEVWETRGWTLVRRIDHGDGKGCRGLAFMPDGKVLAGALGRGVGLWQMPSGRGIRLLEGHSDTLSAVDVSADGRLLLTGSWDGSARLYDVYGAGRNLRTTLRSSLGWGSGKVFGVALAPNQMLAAAAMCQPVCVAVWDVD